MQSTTVDDSPDATFRCEERRELLRQIKEILQGEVTPTATAVLTVTDLGLVIQQWISDGGTKLAVKFFWLSQRLPSHTIDILETPTLLPEDPAHLPKNFRVWNAETQALIKCGDEIVLETHNPDTHPLPDLLQQLTALSGAAEVNDSFRPEDDDDLEDDAFVYDEYGYDSYADESPEPLRLPESILTVG
ncbi:hypothetical protein GX50_05028 [[Emmonsia] crescens]|uniref:Uncharacterized protein n=1 Tax=[Emmonsia] crescens TaxID=73230 RepID=A0A2B7ZG74_9EURO|nr:hypothetical protein GX50_05028 [Emmonsia crescens]